MSNDTEAAQRTGPTVDAMLEWVIANRSRNALTIVQPTDIMYAMTNTKTALTDEQYQALVNVIRHGYPKASRAVCYALKRRGLLEWGVRTGHTVTPLGLKMMERDGR